MKNNHQMRNNMNAPDLMVWDKNERMEEKYARTAMENDWWKLFFPFQLELELKHKVSCCCFLKPVDGKFEHVESSQCIVQK